MTRLLRARAEDGALYVAQFSTGKIFVVGRGAGRGSVVALPLERLVDTPDGIALDARGRLVVLEGAIQSGNGKVVLIDPREKGPRIRVGTLAEGLTSPANLTLHGDTVIVTEAKLRHRLVPGQEDQVPEEFFIRTYELPAGRG